MRVYISGPMVGKDYKNRFAMVAVLLEKDGNIAINPALVTSPDMTFEQYKENTQDLLDACDAILMLDGWQNIVECNVEMARAMQNKMSITFEGGKKCPNPSRPEHGTSQKKPVKKFMSVIKDAFSVKWGTILQRK